MSARDIATGAANGATSARASRRRVSTAITSVRSALLSEAAAARTEEIPPGVVARSPLARRCPSGTPRACRGRSRARQGQAVRRATRRACGGGPRAAPTMAIAATASVASGSPATPAPAPLPRSTPATPAPRPAPRRSGPAGAPRRQRAGRGRTGSWRRGARRRASSFPHGDECRGRADTSPIVAVTRSSPLTPRKRACHGDAAMTSHQSLAPRASVPGATATPSTTPTLA
jgi:hypothetical protein